jgi:glycosyltransferase involved in cell wall biosynthesis
MQVLLVTGMYPSETQPLNGGAVRQQRESLEELGVEFELIHMHDETSLNVLEARKAVRHALHKGSFDLIHVHYGIKATLAALGHGIPIVATYHGTDINGYRITSLSNMLRSIVLSSAAFLVRQCTRFEKAVVVMNQAMKERLPNSSQAKTHVIPMGIDLSKFSRVDRNVARSTLGWDNAPVIAFNNNNNEDIKRQDLAEAAMDILKDRHPEAHLFVVKNIEHGAMPSVLSAADCLLITSDKEGAPNIVREAIACGLPIVSVEVGDVPDLLQQFPNRGCIVSRDPADIAEGIHAVLSGTNDVDSAESLDSVSHQAVAAQVIELYRQVLSQYDS